ncbi:hypothetical protein [uncultured Roseobacter sp.]|uniref:hypothetical protein n=1 Tax=uncultured Roseobacter sp. TaxID=114847 RepID=UPI0026058D6A|nr:hypothetical protein [uncultured Roseobacter sp.]
MTYRYVKSGLRFALLAALVTLALPHAAHAYVGPGLGLGAIAVILGIIGSILLAVFAVLWYPIKRMMKKRKAAADASQPSKD